MMKYGALALLALSIVLMALDFTGVAPGAAGTANAALLLSLLLFATGAVVHHHHHHHHHHPQV